MHGYPFMLYIANAYIAILFLILPELAKTVGSRQVFGKILLQKQRIQNYMSESSASSLNSASYKLCSFRQFK